MPKSLMLVLGLVLLGLGVQPAQAKTNFNLYLGVPYYDYQVGPGYRYYDGRGWYDDERYDDVEDRLTCREARRMVRDRGYYDVRVRECDGRVYSFVAYRNGRRYLIYVNSWTGRIWRG